MRDELQVTDEERHSHFHGNDDHISVDELWQSWAQSAGQNPWTDNLLKVSVFYPLTPGIDQHETSPYNILTLSSKQRMRIFKLIR